MLFNISPRDKRPVLSLKSALKMFSVPANAVGRSTLFHSIIIVTSSFETWGRCWCCISYSVVLVFTIWVFYSHQNRELFATYHYDLWLLVLHWLSQSTCIKYTHQGFLMKSERCFVPEAPPFDQPNLNSGRPKPSITWLPLGSPTSTTESPPLTLFLSISEKSYIHRIFDNTTVNLDFPNKTGITI